MLIIFLLKCICSGTECNWKNDHTSWWAIPHHDYVEDVQASCLAGCDVGINTNTNGLMFTTNSGKQKEQTWRQAKYHVRCEGTSDFNDWYVLISFLLVLVLNTCRASLNISFSARSFGKRSEEEMLFSPF